MVAMSITFLPPHFYRRLSESRFLFLVPLDHSISQGCGFVLMHHQVTSFQFLAVNEPLIDC